MRTRRFIVDCLFLTVLIVYFFVTAPAPLPTVEQNKETEIEIEDVFTLLASENDAARALWTQAIVKDGKLAGLKFSEDWRTASVEAGPLPAMFLREIARNMERNPLRLSLFLGSDFPINTANRFSGDQMAKYQQLKITGRPQFFRENDTSLYTAMFADSAISEACIDCHNDHQDSPKNDWQLLEIMGATTWMYPKSSVSPLECLQLLAMFRESVEKAYLRYLDKVKTFRDPPMIGERWPESGYFLPDSETFMTALEKRSSSLTLAGLLNISGGGTIRGISGD